MRIKQNGRRKEHFIFEWRRLISSPPPPPKKKKKSRKNITIEAWRYFSSLFSLPLLINAQQQRGGVEIRSLVLVYCDGARNPSRGLWN